MPLPLIFRRGNPPRSQQFYSTTVGSDGLAGPSKQGGWRPSPNAQFNSAHPSANRLIVLCPMNEGQGATIHNIAAQAGAGFPSSFSTIGAPAWDADGSGLVCLHSTPSSAGNITGLSFPMAEFTMMAMVTMSGLGQTGVAGGYAVIMGLADATDGFGMYRGGNSEGVNTAHACFFQENSPGGSFTNLDGLGALANVDGKCSVVIMTASTKGSFQRIYVNGTLVNSAAGFSNSKTVTQATFMDSPVIHDGRSTSGTGQLFAIWSRALGGDEVSLLSDYPYDLLLPPRRFYVTFSTTPTVTIAASMANFAGALIKSTSHVIAASMANFAGALTTQTQAKTLLATMSNFAGALVTSHINAATLTASMANFAGALTATKAKGKVIAASMLQFSGSLVKSTQKVLTATMTHFAGALATAHSNASATFSATMANFAGALTRQTNYILTASMAGFHATLAIAVQHGPVPPDCIPAACDTITNIISHVEVCENTGS